MFFKTKDTIGDGFGFSTFGATHLMWLAAFVLLCVLCVCVYKKLNTKHRNVMRICIAAAVVILEIVKDIVVALIGEFTVGYLPFHLCGINVLLIAFCIFKRNKTVENFLYYIGIPGAMLALLFPNWTTLPCVNFFNIHSFIIHMLLVLFPLILVTSGEVKPDIKIMPKCVVLLVGMAIPIYFINLASIHFGWDESANFMFLMNPETGNPLGLFEKYLGNHLWGFPVLLPIVLFVMYIPIFISNKIKNVRKTKELVNT